jgi:hypothetical protein
MFKFNNKWKKYKRFWKKKINQVKVIKNFYIIVDEIDGKPIAKRVYKGEDGEEFEEELNEDIEKYIKDKDQIQPGNKFEVAVQEEEYPIGKSTKVRVFTIVKNQKGEDERFDEGEELDDFIDFIFEDIPKSSKLKSGKKPEKKRQKRKNEKKDKNEKKRKKRQKWRK